MGKEKLTLIECLAVVKCVCTCMQSCDNCNFRHACNDYDTSKTTPESVLNYLYSISKIIN